MKLQLHSPNLARLRARLACSPPPGGRLPELDPLIVEVPVQVVIYPIQDPIVFEGTIGFDAEGDAAIVVPVPMPIPGGTPIQIIVHGNPEIAPIVFEGLTGDPQIDGTIDVVIDIPDGLMD